MTSWPANVRRRVVALIEDIARVQNGGQGTLPWMAESERLLPLLRERKAPAKRLPGESKAAKREERRNSALTRRRKIYAEVDRRSEGVCEMIGTVIECRNDAVEHDHFWGRGKVRETSQNVWHLCRFHHDNKTRNDPSRAAWIRFFLQHCYRHKFREEMAKCDRALALENAQHPRGAAHRAGAREGT